MSEKVLTGKKARVHRPYPAVHGHCPWGIPVEVLDAACKRAYGPEWQYSDMCGDCETVEKEPIFNDKIVFRPFRR